MPLTPQQTQRLLDETSLKAVEAHDLLPSTNDRALQLARAGDVVTPTLVLAEHQTAGRGRGANTWWSADGALTFTLLQQAPAALVDSQRLHFAALVTGVALCESIQALYPDPEVGIKWPNDIFVRDRKVAGILIESIPGPVAYLCIGVGLNLNNSIQAAPTEILDRATSLIDLTQNPQDPTAALISILQHLESQFAQFAESSTHFVERLNERSVLNGKRLTIAKGRREYFGHCEGIDDNGELVLQTETGTERFASGIVKSYDSH